MTCANLNAAAFLKDSLVVGPGIRDALWVQGCSILCPGCGNPDYLPHVTKRLLPVEDLLRHFRQRIGKIDGISVLGGEPTEQAEGVASLLEGVQSLGFSTVVFTGNLYEDLVADSNLHVERMLAATDLLIDGPYIAKERDPSMRWRGSRNQRLLCLTPRLRGKMPGDADPASEIVLRDDYILTNGVKRLRLPYLAKI